MTANMIYIVAHGVGLKCPRKIHLNTQCPPPTPLLKSAYVIYEWYLARQVKGLTLVQREHCLKPLVEFGIGFDVVGISGALQQFDLGQHFELFPSLVKVDEAVVSNV